MSDRSSAHSNWLRESAHLWLCALAIAAPLFLPDHLPMVDLPQHAAQVGTLSHLIDGTSAFTDFFRINWFTPYLLGYLLVAGLTPLFGISMACKLVVAAALGLIPVATGRLLSSVGGSTRWAWLTLPAVYGFAFHWGFLNFLVAIPIGIFFLTMVMRHNAAPRMRSGVAVAVALPFIFFAHALVCIFMVGLAAVDACLRMGGFKDWLKRLYPLLPVLPVMLVWGILTLSSERQVHAPIVWDLGWHRLTQLPQLIFSTSGDNALPWVGVALLAVPLLSGSRISHQAWRHGPWIACLSVLLFVPHVVFGNAFTYQRFGVLFAPLLLLPLQPAPAGPRSIARFSPLLIAVVSVIWTGMISLNMQGFARESKGFDDLIEKANPNGRLLQMMVFRDSRFSPAPVFLHYGSWYQAERGGMVDFSFANFAIEAVRYRADHQPPAGSGFEWQPLSFNWQFHQGDRYDYFLVRAPMDLSMQLFRDAPVKPRLIGTQNNWWLYQRADLVK